MRPDRTAKNFLISGRVRGVGFRAFTESAALEIGVTGWVRNLADGRVEAHANGTPAQLDDFEGRLRTGPRRSEVRSVDSSDAAVSEAVTFTIR
ncbi:MAG: acylphosphatase [Bryobacteraceae bacterium]